MDVVSILGNIGGAITRMFGSGRKQADIVTHAYDGGIRALLDGIIYGSLTRGASAADLARVQQDLQYAQNWWRDNVLSKVTDDRGPLKTAQFIYSGHEQNDQMGISSFPFAWDYLREAMRRAGSAPGAPPAPSGGLPVQVFPVDPGFTDFSFPIGSPAFNTTQQPRSWDQLLTDALETAASRAARRSTPAPAAAVSPSMPDWVLPAAAVAGLWLLFGRRGR